jgi:hypothetical protein
MNIYDYLVQWCLSHRTDEFFPALYVSGKRPFVYAICDIRQKQGSEGYTIVKGSSWDEVKEKLDAQTLT